ncbi:hypothetical protein MKX01_001923 [Papaver californicum]|nr:hypothetical protein MKX01_001923 [Papaver californicum]
MAIEDQVVIIVGAGPSGIATSACLNHLSIPNIVLERDDCLASIWTKKSYDHYLESYATHFNVNPLYNRCVELATFDEDTKKWNLKVKNTGNTDNNEGFEEYVTRFLVVATGETTDAYIPDIEGLSGFKGDILRSTEFKNGEKFTKKNVHIINKETAYLGLRLLKHLPLNIIDGLFVFLSKIVYEGPFLMKGKYGKYPILDVGTFNKIKSGHIQVLPAIKTITGDCVEFVNGKSYQFDVLLFATGFTGATNKWLKDDDFLIGENGISKQSFPNNWKGKNGLYCAGLARNGIYGTAVDAQKIAADINTLLESPVS